MYFYPRAQEKTNVTYSSIRDNHSHGTVGDFLKQSIPLNARKLRAELDGPIVARPVKDAVLQTYERCQK